MNESNQGAGQRPASLSDAPVRGSRYTVTPWSVQRLYRPYVRASIWVAILLGFGTGAGMLAAPAFGADRALWYVVHAQAHGVAQLFGWAGLFAMGVAFHVVPRFRNGSVDFPWPQRAILVLILGGVTLRFFGQSLHRRAVSGPMLEASGVALLVAVVIFAVVLARTLARGDAGRTRTELWVAASLGWAIVAGAIHLRIVFDMAAADGALANGLWNAALIQALAVGFLGNLIFAVSTRAVRGFLGLAPMRRVAEVVAFAAINGGTAWFVFARLTEASDGAAAIGMLIQAAGLALFVFALRIFEPRAERRPYFEGTYVRYEWFVRAAYLWLLGSALLEALAAVSTLTGDRILAPPLGAPTIHVLTLGFVTMIIFGMTSRMVALFEGSEVPHQRLMDFAFVALNASVMTRVGFGFGEVPGADIGLAVSGVLGLAALLAFAWVTRGIFTDEQREKYRRRAAEFGRQQFVRSEMRRPGRGTQARGGDGV